MTTNALVIDCDGHILEPPDLWEAYLEPEYRDRALRIRIGDDGFEQLLIDGRPSIRSCSKPSSPIRMRSARSRYSGSRYASHRSGGSRMWPSQSITSAFVVMAASSASIRDVA